MSSRLARSTAIATATMLSFGLLAACGGSDDSGSSTSSGGPAASASTTVLKADSAIESLVPEAIKKKGTLVFATDATAPPNESVDTDGKTIVGNEIDIAKNLASLMGLKAEFVNVSFDSIIPGLQAHRYDLSISGFRDTKEREKVVDFVTYAKAGPQFFVKSSSSFKPTGLDDLCGHSFAVQSGTIQEDIAQQQNEKCTAAGKKSVDVKVFKTQDQQVQAVANGQVDVGAQNGPNNVYTTQQTNGAIVASGKPFAEGPWGMPLPKDTGLVKALHAATQKLIDDPAYLQILKKWNVSDQAITKSVINGAIS
ncbi:ABC transporter substrate-binding protein [Streptomyces sp. NPDC002491]